MKEKKMFPIYINWPGADEGSMVPFSYDKIDENGRRKTFTVWVKANEPVEVEKEVYDIWVDSIYNPNRKKSEGLIAAEKKITGKGNPSVMDYLIRD